MLGRELGKWGQKMSRMWCVEYVFWELESCISVNVFINTDTRSSFRCFLSPAFYCLCIFFLYLLFMFSFYVSILFLLPVFSLVFFTTYLSTQTIWFQFLEVLTPNILEGGARSVAADWGTTLQTEVAGSISDGVIGIFHWHNPSGRTMALR